MSVPTINEHLQNIFQTGELEQVSTIRNFRIVQREGNRDVTREIDFYNLDVVIAVGYRVNSYHHIHPRELGGDNDFDNLVPVLREVHQSEFNEFWRNW